MVEGESKWRAKEGTDGIGRKNGRYSSGMLRQRKQEVQL